MKTNFKIPCYYCHTPMELDDCDFSFNGCYDNLWVCPKCSACATEVVRYSKTIRIDWFKKFEYGTDFDFTQKFKISSC